MSRSDGRLGPAGLIAVGQTAVKGSQLALAVILVRLLDAGSWNQLAFLLSIHLAIVTFGGIGLQQSLLFYVAQPAAPVRDIVTRTVLLVAAVAALLATSLWLAAPLIGSTLGVENLVPIVGLAAALELPPSCVQPSLIALERFQFAARWDLAGAALQLVSVIGGALIGGTRGAVIGLLLCSATRCGALLFTLRSSAMTATTAPSPTAPASLGAVASAPRLLTQLAFALPLGLTLATGVLTRSIDKWFIAFFHPSDIGGYSIAAQEVPLLTVVPYAGSAAGARRLATAFAVDDRTTAHHLWTEQVTAMSRIVVPLSVALMLFAPAIVPLATDSRQSALVITFMLFSAVTLHRVAEYGLLLRAAGQPRDLLMSGLVLLAANTVLAGIGAWRWSMPGSAAGTLAANVIAWCFVLHRVARALGVSFAQAFPWARWATSVASSAIAAGAALAAGSAMHGTVARVAIEAAAFVGIVILADRTVKAGRIIQPRVSAT